MNKKRYVYIIIVVLVGIIISLFVFTNKEEKNDNSNYVSNSNEVVTIDLEEEYSLELGSTPNIDMFTSLKGANMKIYYNNEEVIGSLNKGGEYLVVIMHEGKEYKTKILVEENIPILTLKELVINEGNTYELDNFVVSISGTNDYKLEFTNLNMGKYNKPGIYDIGIKLVYNNEKTVVEYTKLTIKEIVKSNRNIVSNSTSNKSNSNNTSNKNSNKTSNKLSNNTNNKPISNSNSNIPSSNSNITSNSNSNVTSNTNNGPIEIVKQESKTDTTTSTKYGAKIITTTTYTLVTYSNGTTQKKNSSSKTTLDSTGFITSTSNMKSEATNILNSRTSEQNEMLNYVNKYRKEKDSSLNNLVIDKDLSLAATIRAMELAYTEYKYKHQRPNGKEFYTVLNDLGIKFKATGENIAYGYGGALITVKQAAESWKASASHYETLTSPKYTKIGVGHVTLLGKEYWVQLFVG